MARRRRSPTLAAPVALLALCAAAAATLAGWCPAFAAPPPVARLGWQAPGARARPGAAAAAAAAAAEGPGAYSVGGPRTQAVLTAAIAAASIYLLSIANEATRLALWAPPLGAAALIFAQASTAAAAEGTLWSPRAVATQASQLAVALGGSCTIAVLLSKLLGPSALTRALSVACCSLWMTAVPVSSYFPPVGAFCVLYLDQVMAKGPLAALVYKYAMFPCVAGTLFLVVVTRLLTIGVAPLLRRLQK